MWLPLGLREAWRRRLPRCKRKSPDAARLVAADSPVASPNQAPDVALKQGIAGSTAAIALGIITRRDGPLHQPASAITGAHLSMDGGWTAA
jgi:hypothetical protein